MNKDQIKTELDNIEVPHAELSKAVNNGIMNGVKDRDKRKRRFVLYPAIALAMVIALCVSGFIFPSMGKVLANVPFVGWVYTNNYVPSGENFEPKGLLNQSQMVSSDKGIDVTILKSYFDTGNIAIEYIIESAKESEEAQTVFEVTDMESGEPVEILQFHDLSTSTGDKTGFIELSSNEKNLQSKRKLELKFTEVNGTKGEWKFELPQEQLQVEITTPNTRFTDETGKYAIQINKITHGQATTLIDYQIEQPKGTGTVDGIKMNFENADITYSGAYISSQTTENSDIAYYRSCIVNSSAEPKNVIASVVIFSETENLMVNIHEELPVTLKSSFNPVSLNFTNITEDADTIQADIMLQNLPSEYPDWLMELSKEEITEMLYFSEMYLSSKVYAETYPESGLDEPDGFVIKGNSVKKIGDHYQVTFNKNDATGFKNRGEGREMFSENNAYIFVPMGNFGVQIKNIEIPIGN